MLGVPAQPPQIFDFFTISLPLGVLLKYNLLSVVRAYKGATLSALSERRTEMRNIS